MSSAESIYKLVEKPKAEERPKGPLYKSKYDPKGPLIGSTFGMEGTTAVDGKGVHSIKKVSSSSLSLHWDTNRLVSSPPPQLNNHLYLLVLQDPCCDFIYGT
jgi:hypothetical protein